MEKKERERHPSRRKRDVAGRAKKKKKKKKDTQAGARATLPGLKWNSNGSHSHASAR
jgi:hypothetical protein